MVKHSRSAGAFNLEKILRQLVEEIPALFWATDRALQLRVAFGGGWALLGRQPNDVLGQTVQEVFATSDAAAPLIAVHHRALAGESVRLSWPWAGREFQMRVVPLLEPNGAVYGCAVEGRDVTEQRQTEQALQRAREDLESRVRQRTAELASANARLRAEIDDRHQMEKELRLSEQRFRLAFEEGPIGMAFVSLDGVILLANRALCRMLDYSQAELEGGPSTTITHPDDIAVAERLNQQTHRGEIPGYVLEQRYLTRTGSVIWARYTAAVIRDQDGRPLYTFGIVEPIERGGKG